MAGIGFGIGHKAVIVDTSLTGTTAIPITRPVAGSATKTVEFKGYQISVPASWPVYWLNKDPQQCVRYDVNAVYVGTPGANQQCPPGLIGRTQTVSIGGQAGQPAQFTPAQTGQQAMLPAEHGTADLSAALGTIMQNAALQELAVAMPSAAPAVTGTYGADLSEVEQILATVKQEELGPDASASPSPSPSPSPTHGTQSTAPKQTATPRTGDSAKRTNPASAANITLNSPAASYLWEYEWLIAISGLPVPWTLALPEPPAAPRISPQVSPSPTTAAGPNRIPAPKALPIT